MEENKITKIVQKLSARAEIFTDRRRLNDGLGLNNTDYLEWDVKCNTGVYTHYDVLTRMVNGWVSRQGDGATIAALQSCLRKMNFVAAADSLEGIHDELTGGCTAFERKHTNHTNLNLPHIDKPDASFTGRTGLIADIINHLTKRCNKDHRIGFPLVILYALGGFGKTQLSRKIVLETRKSSTFTNFIWITAEFEDGIKRELYDIARDHLHIEPARSVEFKNFLENDYNKLTINFYSKLQSNGSLIIFDNVESFKVLLKYLPLDQDTDVSVLVTSRRKWDDRSLQDLGEIENISVSLLTQSDALDLVMYILRKFGKLVRDEESVQELIETSGRIPLLLNLMASTIANVCDTNSSYSIVEYVEQLGPDDVIDICNGDEDLRFQYYKNLGQCVACSVKCLEGSSELGNLAKIIFDYLMYCNIEHVEVDVILEDIEQIIKQASSIGIKMQGKIATQQVLRNALNLLSKFSLIELIPYNGKERLKAEIHRLIQEAHRKALIDSGMEEAILKKIMDIYWLDPRNELGWPSIRFSYRCRANPKIWSFVLKYPDLVTKYYQKKETLEYITIYDSVETVRTLVQRIGLEKFACDLEQSYSLHNSFFQTEAMQVALFWNKVDIANFFITCGAVGKSSKCRDSWLYAAVKYGPLDILQKIMNHFGVDVDHIVSNDVTKYGYHFFEYLELADAKLDSPYASLLEIAADEGMLPILKYLLDNGANYLLFANSHKLIVKKYEVMKIFLNQPGFDLQAYEQRIGTSLICQKEFWLYNDNNIKSIKLLLAHGSSPPWVFHPADKRTTILHYAVQFSDDQCVKYILNIHPEWLEVRDKLGNTPLIIAAAWDIDIVELLLARNADVNASNSKRKTALIQAVKGKNLKVVKVLLENRADVNTADRQGDKPIHYASPIYREQHEQIIQMLVDHDADIYAAGNKGDTILHKQIQEQKAVQKDNLLDGIGFSVHNWKLLFATGNKGDPILHKRIIRTNLEEDDFLYGIEFLVQHWSSLRVIRNDDSFTPLQLAQIRFANFSDNFKAKVFQLLSSPSE